MGFLQARRRVWGLLNAILSGPTTPSKVILSRHLFRLIAQCEGSVCQFISPPSISRTHTNEHGILMAGSRDHSDTTPIYSRNLQTAPTDISATRYDGNLNESSRSDDNCVICLDTISEPCATHPCAHTHFDFLCLLSWLEQRASCPLCQSPVFKVSYTDSEKRGESVYRVPNVPRKRKEELRNLPEIRSQRTSFGPAESNASRLFRRQRPRRETPRPPISEADAIEHRRHVYRHLLYSLRRCPNSCVR